MEPESPHIFRNRNFYRKRRNFIRRIFFVIVLFGCVFFVFKTIAHVNASSLKIEISGDKLINKNFLLKSIESQTNKKNFFFLSPRRIATDLYGLTQLVEDVVIRKYIFPDVKIYIFLKEKNIWGRISNKEDGRYFDLVTDDGNIIPAGFLNLSNLPANLLDINFYAKSSMPTKDVLMSLNKLFKDLITYDGLVLHNFTIDNKNRLDILCNVDDAMLLKIKAGGINENLQDKLINLTQIIKTVRTKQYEVEYIDLTSENSAIIKTFKEDDRKPNFFKERKKKQL